MGNINTDRYKMSLKFLSSTRNNECSFSLKKKKKTQITAGFSNTLLVSEDVLKSSTLNIYNWSDSYF